MSLLSSRLWLMALLALGASAQIFGVSAQAESLAAIKAAHHLECGTVLNVDDWSAESTHGDLSALGGEICRAVAVAIFGDDSALKIQAFPAETGAFAALQAGKVQFVAGVSPSAAMAMHFGVAYTRPFFFDSQRFLVARDSGVADLKGLRDKLICAMDMGRAERNLQDEMKSRGVPVALQSHSEQGEMDAAVSVRRCIGTGLESRLAESRSNFHARVDDFVFLPERLSLAPVVAAYPSKDADFGMLVDWTISALVEAESLGIDKITVETAKTREDMRARELLGGDFATALAFGLAHDWVAKVIAVTGNYGEIFERAVGEPYKLERGLNQLWTRGGLMAPAPMK